MTDPALWAKIDSLSPEERDRALAIMKRVASWAGDLLAVDVHQAASGAHVTLHFQNGTLGFYHSRAQGHGWDHD